MEHLELSSLLSMFLKVVLACSLKGSKFGQMVTSISNKSASLMFLLEESNSIMA